MAVSLFLLLWVAHDVAQCNRVDELARRLNVTAWT